jgi:RHH-type transcriptional regulator, proline utilization regulon repressor / proline dehydrogenase / delta 1-pyrroline-5-carboxylate dehydrogenase
MHVTAPDVRLREAMSQPLSALQAWADGNQVQRTGELCSEYRRTLAKRYHPPAGNGPTGERNSYAILPREHVLCLAEVEGDLLTQLAAVLAVGSSAILPESELTKALLATPAKRGSGEASRVWPTGPRTT